MKTYQRPKLPVPEKHKSLLKVFRAIQEQPLVALSEKSGVTAQSICQYEKGRKMPGRGTVVDLANGLNIDPDLLMYSFGYLPDYEAEIVRRDPFYFMDKIKKLCKNYEDKEPSLDELNRRNYINCHDYMQKIKGSENNEKEG